MHTYVDYFHLRKSLILLQMICHIRIVVEQLILVYTINVMMDVLVYPGRALWTLTMHTQYQN